MISLVFDFRQHWHMEVASTLASSPGPIHDSHGDCAGQNEISGSESEKRTRKIFALISAWSHDGVVSASRIDQLHHEAGSHSPRHDYPLNELYEQIRHPNGEGVGADPRIKWYGAGA